MWPINWASDVSHAELETMRGVMPAWRHVPRGPFLILWATGGSAPLPAATNSCMAGRLSGTYKEPLWFLVQFR